jgi:hypothetical protein
MTDYAVRCFDCGFIALPLSRQGAVEAATEHCDRQIHSDVHAMSVGDAAPIVGYLETEHRTESDS